MRQEQFWALVDSTRPGGINEDNGMRHANALVKKLVKLGHEETADYSNWYDRFDECATTSGLWTAGDILCGGLSDDGFTDFRAWLISQGQDWYMRAVADPETLATFNHPPGTNSNHLTAENFGYVGQRAWEELGRDDDIPIRPELRVHPGSCWGNGLPVVRLSTRLRFLT